MLDNGDWVCERDTWLVNSTQQAATKRILQTTGEHSCVEQRLGFGQASTSALHGAAGRRLLDIWDKSCWSVNTSNTFVLLKNTTD